MTLLEHLERRWKTQRRKISVPEFTNGSGDFELYFSPYSGLDQQKIGPHLQKDTVEALWKILLEKAEDEEGNKLFKAADKDTVLGCLEAKVLDRIATEMLDAATPEQAAKN